MPDTEPSGPRTSSAISWLDGLLVVCGLCLAGLLGAVAIRNSDVWLHLATGRAIARGEYQFGVDPFGFATAGRVWVNHSWLYDLGTYALHQAAGGKGLALARSAVAILLFMTLLLVRKPGGLALPAIGAALAMIAINARLPYLQPALLSYLFLAVLMARLDRGGRWLPLEVGLLCAVWANIDGWFILGPITVALWFVGAFFTRSDSGPSPRVLGFALAAALVGGLANPHHVRAFAIPDELAPGFFDDDVQNDPLFLQFSAGSLDLKYGERAGPAPSMAYYVLLALGVASFALNLPARPWGRLLIWTVFAGLAIWRWRMVPFFAVACTPLMVLNWQEFLARLRVGQAARMIGVAMRSVATAGLILLILAAWPGWLGARPDEPLRAHRVAPKIATDPAFERLATQVGEWIAAGKLAPGERIFSPSVEASHYLAWFAPGAQSFFDLRFRLNEPLAADYLSARKALLGLGEPVPVGQPMPTLEAVEPFLRKYGITSVIMAGADRGEGVGAARILWTEPQRWPFRALAGRVVLFGWIDPQSGQDPHPELRIDPSRLAFAPQEASTRPSPSTADLQLPSFWDVYRSGPPAPPIELVEGYAWMEFTAVSALRSQRLHLAAQHWLVAASVGAGTSPAMGASLIPQIAANRITASRLFSQRDSDPDVLAGPILAIRTLRTAQMRAPDDPNVYRRLAQAYSGLATMPDLIHFQNFIQHQRGVALQQAQLRLEIAAAWGMSMESARFDVANELAMYHLSKQRSFGDGRIFYEQLDIGVEMARTALKLLPPNQFSSEAEFERERAGRTEKLKQLEKLLQDFRNDYELNAERQPTRRFELALSRGLPKEALDVVQAGQQEGQPNVDLIQLLHVLISLGRAEEARATLRSERFYPITTVPPERRTAVRRLQMLAAAGCGDLEALKFVSDETAELQAARGSVMMTANRAVIALTAPVSTGPLIRVSTTDLWFSAVQEHNQLIGRIFETSVWRGLLALEAGDTRTARRAFEEGNQAYPPSLRFSDRIQVERYVNALPAADR